MQIRSIFLAADTAEAMPPAEQGFMQTLIMVGIALLMFYVILWRPEQKRRKKEEAKRNALKKGDRVTTMSGILGVVIKINPDTVVLRMVDNNKIEFLKASIADVQPATEEEAKKLAAHDD